MASVKVVRKPASEQTTAQPAQLAQQSGSAAKPAAYDEVSYHIVEAEEQNLLEVPSQKSTDLIPLLNTQENTSDAVLPAALSMVCKLPHAGIAVRFEHGGVSFTRSCSQVLALVQSTCASRVDQIGDGPDAGFKLVTDNVVDPMAAKEFKCSTTAFCNLTNTPSFQLNPPRSQKVQWALLLISDILQQGSAEKPAVFLVDSVQKLTVDEAQKALPYLKQLMYFTAAASQNRGTKRTRTGWTESESPAIASKCKGLGRSPTGGHLPEYGAST